MPFTDTGKGIMLDALATEINQVSLHSASPGTNGANELSGAYNRKVPSWAASALGEKALSAPIIFDVPAGATVTHVGFWDGDSPERFLGYAALTAPEDFAAAGTFTLTAATKLDINDS